MVDRVHAHQDAIGIIANLLVVVMTGALETLAVILHPGIALMIGTVVVPIGSVRRPDAVARAPDAVTCHPSSRKSLCSLSRPFPQATSRS